MFRSEEGLSAPDPQHLAKDLVITCFLLDVFWCGSVVMGGIVGAISGEAEILGNLVYRNELNLREQLCSFWTLGEGCWASNEMDHRGLWNSSGFACSRNKRIPFRCPDRWQGIRNESPDRDSDKAPKRQNC